MAVTAFIERFKTASGSQGISDKQLGLDTGMGSQAPFTASTNLSAVGSEYLVDPDLALSYLREIYKPLKRHYDWFRRTQRGQIKQYGRKARSKREAYRWRGRTPTHILTSGMDDYPRGPPHAGELHLDLISWVAFFTRTMRDIAAFVGEKDDELTFIDIEASILGNIEGILFGQFTVFVLNVYLDLHWNEEQKMYCDLNINDDGKFYPPCPSILTVLTERKMSLIMFVTRVTCLSFHFSSNYFHPCHLTWDIYWISSTIPNIYGLLMVSEVCLRLIQNLDKAKTTGKGQYGFK
jgi:mannosyl-oligosaccharide glucosidase